MRPEGVVVVTPVFDDASGVVQVHEPFQVQALIAHLAIEGFDDAVLCGFSRLDEVQLDLVPVGPLVQSAPGELRPIIDLNHLFFTALVACGAGRDAHQCRCPPVQMPTSADARRLESGCCSWM